MCSLRLDSLNTRGSRLGLNGDSKSGHSEGGFDLLGVPEGGGGGWVQHLGS